jgi:hypothetical protein
MTSYISVLLFRNDGRLEALNATPYHLDSELNFNAIKRECYRACAVGLL